MFNCYNHGWSHIERACPFCFPVITYTGSNSGYVPPATSIFMTDERLQKMQDLEQKLAIAVEALEQVVDACSITSTDVATEALAKISGKE